ncbi:MAG: hypothetical protein OSJ60_01960 [Lachnospiraceae bacterium]|nr:hypothetical protein C819_02233 [Lachnospiraceae bacterium 10-1]MCX4350378.1 hypothetical protein [Lachnospiraceae bacterium]
MATLEEKISKAKESAMKKAEKDGLNEDAANKLVAEAVAKVQKAWDEEERKKAEQPKKYTVKVTNNPKFCGIGAGGVQFANGEAKITSDRMAAWFKEHEGYEVIEQ